MLKAGWRAVGGIREVVILSGSIGIVLLEVTCEQRAGSKGASHAALPRKTVSGRGTARAEVLSWVPRLVRLMNSKEARVSGWE